MVVGEFDLDVTVADLTFDLNNVLCTCVLI